MMKIDIPYYQDTSRISNSNIGQFLKYGPNYLYRMLNGKEEGEKGPQLERGTLIHSYLLTPEEFQKTYVVWDKSRPFSAQQEKFCQALASSLEIEPNKAILDAYKQAYSTAGKSEDKMLSEGLKIASTLKEYIDYLKDPERKQMITPSEYQMLKRIKNNFKAHKLAWKLLWPAEENMMGSIPPPMSNLKHYHEFHINWEAGYDIIDLTEYYPVKCKSLLDSLTLDFKNKKATIMDLKTTAKLWHFEESIEMYDYCRQLCYYTRAVEWYLEEELHENPGDWTFEYYIIGIDTTGSNEIRVFKINEDDVEARDNTICDALGEIAWHQMNNKWEHSRAYYEGDGSETLNL